MSTATTAASATAAADYVSGRIDGSRWFLVPGTSATPASAAFCSEGR